LSSHPRIRTPSEVFQDWGRILWRRDPVPRVCPISDAPLLAACAVTAIRGAIRIGRVRTAVTIQSAASSAVSPGLPS